MVSWKEIKKELQQINEDTEPGYINADWDSIKKAFQNLGIVRKRR